MNDSPVPLDGASLLVGPSGVGKTRLTARALDAWLDHHGTDGVVVLEFAPEVERDGEVLGGRLDRFRTVPDAVWHGVLDAHAPRSDATNETDAVALARENAERAEAILEAAPTPTAVFVNDATIPFQHEVGDLSLLTGHCERADCAVVNAFSSDELGTDDPVSGRERATLDELRAWMDQVVDLS